TDTTSRDSILQTESVEKTAEAVHQIEQMANSTSINAMESKTISNKTKTVAHEGLEAMKKLIEAFGKIKESNNLMFSQIENYNQQLSEIVNSIQEIESKTQIINDIVFQTKLLSFNASVESARAGEHGKGFAVVAEEVGNLASMS